MRKFGVSFIFILIISLVGCQDKKEIVEPGDTVDIIFKFVVCDSNNVERNQFDSTDSIYVKFIIDNLSDDTVEYKHVNSNLDDAVSFLIYHDTGVFVDIIGSASPSSFIYTAYLPPHTSKIWEEVVKLENGDYLATYSATLQFDYEKYTYEISPNFNHISFTVL